MFVWTRNNGAYPMVMASSLDPFHNMGFLSSWPLILQPTTFFATFSVMVAMSSVAARSSTLTKRVAAAVPCFSKDQALECLPVYQRISQTASGNLAFHPRTQPLIHLSCFQTRRHRDCFLGSALTDLHVGRFSKHFLYTD